VSLQAYWPAYKKIQAASFLFWLVDAAIHSIPAVPAIENINNCPPPSRIFCGRQDIMNQMIEYFGQRLQKQQVFLLHGLGGAGKSQIALKFIQESDQLVLFLCEDATKTLQFCGHLSH
jgi:hypothetical protein